jgi:hypothetical protein
MRRRPVDFRRPVRRRVSNVLWWVLSGIAILLFIFVLSKGSQIESRPEMPKVKKRSGFCLVSYSLIYTLKFYSVCFADQMWESEGTKMLNWVAGNFAFWSNSDELFNFRKRGYYSVIKPGVSLRHLETREIQI